MSATETIQLDVIQIRLEHLQELCKCQCIKKIARPTQPTNKTANHREIRNEPQDQEKLHGAPTTGDTTSRCAHEHLLQHQKFQGTLFHSGRVPQSKMEGP